MADAFVAEVASGLVFKLVSLATEEVIQAWNLHEDLEALRERSESVDALLADAHTKKLTMSAVQNWFNKLQAVAHVADVFMDELAYEVTRQKVENHHKVRNFFIPSKNSILYRFKVARKVKSLHTSFDKIFKWARDLGLQPVASCSTAVQLRDIQNTPPFEDVSQIVGRDEDISYLVHMVCKTHEYDLPVIAVVGMGGQGKTTLARMVYNTAAVINMFPKRMWVTVSDDFNLIKILNQMVQSLTSTNLGLGNAEGIINVLQKNLKNEKFLLVLDDVWNEKSVEWENLRNSLLGVGSARGSNILITTRKQEVTYAIQYCVPHSLEKLSEDDSWALFKQRAFSHRGVLPNETLVALGRSMVERCGGLPLALKALGGLLHSKDSEQEWQLIKDSETWKLKDVLPSLRLSYDNLPYSSLQQCFTYLSIMPKDTVIYKNDLVHIWMALGFLLPPRDSDALMEDIGNEYFNILLWNSLLQDVERDEYGNIISCKMHDLVHDLALNLSKHHSVTVKEGHELDHISKAIYVRIDKRVSYIKPKILKRNFERVRILYANQILVDVLPNLKHLTVLVLNTNEADIQLPSSLPKMKCLKHLDISCFRNELPGYIMELYNLQTLRVWNLQELPKRLCNLINLRHLYIVNPNSRCMLFGIERLTCLQTLPHFVVSRDQNCFVGQLGGLTNLRGKLEIYGLCQVENMQEASKAELFRKPRIHCLLLDWSNNDNKGEYREYNDEDVMKGLDPHPNLEELIIENFEGKYFASWITIIKNLVKITVRNCKTCEGFPSLGHLPKLREMEIISMDNLKVIGSDICGDLVIDARDLSNGGITSTVTTMYPSLKTLILWDLPKLEIWMELVMSTAGKHQGSVLGFPKLEVLDIKSCSKLKRIPSSCFPSLKMLEITNLESRSMILETMSRKVTSLSYLRLRSIIDEGGHSSSSSSPSNMDSIIADFLRNNSESLALLNLHDCQGLTCLTLGVALEEIRVSDCPDLTSINVVEESCRVQHLVTERCLSLLDLVFVQSMRSTLVKLTLDPFSEELDEFPWPFASSYPNLISLELWGWEKLKSIFPEGQPDDHLSSTFPALSHLAILNFEGVKTIPDSLAELPSLKTLFIRNCKNLEKLPTFKKSHNLQFLDIYGCPVIRERYRSGSGEDWFKIQHIAQIYW